MNDKLKKLKKLRKLSRELYMLDDNEINSNIKLQRLKIDNDISELHLAIIKGNNEKIQEDLNRLKECSKSLKEDLIRQQNLNEATNIVVKALKMIIKIVRRF